jgi:hypothetical protein
VVNRRFINKLLIKSGVAVVNFNWMRLFGCVPHRTSSFSFVIVVFYVSLSDVFVSAANKSGRCAGLSSTAKEFAKKFVSKCVAAVKGTVRRVVAQPRSFLGTDCVTTKIQIWACGTEVQDLCAGLFQCTFPPCTVIDSDFSFVLFIDSYQQLPHIQFAGHHDHWPHFLRALSCVSEKSLSQIFSIAYPDSGSCLHVYVCVCVSKITLQLIPLFCSEHLRIL